MANAPQESRDQRQVIVIVFRGEEHHVADAHGPVETRVDGCTGEAGLVQSLAARDEVLPGRPTLGEDRRQLSLIVVGRVGPLTRDIGRAQPGRPGVVVIEPARE